MAKKTKKTDNNPHPGKYCRDCGHHYDEQSQSFHDGHMILCRCPFYTGGKWCKFMSDAACIHFTETPQRHAPKTT